MNRTILVRLSLAGLSVLAMAGCKPVPAQKAEVAPSASATPAHTEPAVAAPAMSEAESQAAYMEQEHQAQLARAAADPVAGVIERAELCLHFAGEEGYDADRRAQIDKAFADNRCDAVVADGEALKASHPHDAARIDAALADLRS